MRQTYGVTFAGATWALPTRTDANRVRRVLRHHAEAGGRCDQTTLDALVGLAMRRAGVEAAEILSEFNGRNHG